MAKDIKTVGDGSGEGVSAESRMSARAERQKFRFGQPAKPQFVGEVLTAEENKCIDYILSLKGNGVNPSCYHFVKGTKLDREQCMEAIQGLVALGLVGTYVSGRGATVYCKCGELLS